MFTMCLQETLLRASWCLCVDGVYNTWSLESWFCVRTVYTIHNVYNVSWELADACAWTVYIQLYTIQGVLISDCTCRRYILNSILYTVVYYAESVENCCLLSFICAHVSWEWSCVQRWELYTMCTNTLYSVHSTQETRIHRLLRKETCIHHLLRAELYAALRALVYADDPGSQ